MKATMFRNARSEFEIVVSFRKAARYVWNRIDEVSERNDSMSRHMKCVAQKFTERYELDKNIEWTGDNTEFIVTTKNLDSEVICGIVSANYDDANKFLIKLWETSKKFQYCGFYIEFEAKERFVVSMSEILSEYVCD